MRVSPLSRNFKSAAPAQAQHSPLPWKVSDSKPPKIIIAGRPGFIATLGYPHEGNREANAAYIVRACNNAQRLADALKGTLATLSQSVAFSDESANNQQSLEILRGDCFAARQILSEALAEWSKQK